MALEFIEKSIKNIFKNHYKVRENWNPKEKNKKRKIKIKQSIISWIINGLDGKKKLKKDQKLDQINLYKPLYNMNQRLNQFSSNHGKSREEEKMNNHKAWIK